MFSPDYVDLCASALAELPRAWGYLDPGAGSMLLQIMLAGALSGLFFMKSCFRQLREYLPLKSTKA
jgi:hypothetical protein